jgi:5-methylcytosine-specific restriction protein A
MQDARYLLAHPAHLPMPAAPKRPCAAAGCHSLAARDGYCERCQSKRPTVLYDHARGNSNARLYGRRWRGASKAFLVEHPFCAGFRMQHRSPVLATQVDHIVPHRGELTLFWGVNNWQGLCDSCHARKSASGL